MVSRVLQKMNPARAHRDDVAAKNVAPSRQQAVASALARRWQIPLRPWYPLLARPHRGAMQDTSQPDHGSPARTAGLPRGAAMRIIVRADHAGFPLKGTVVEALRSWGHEVEDVGT